MDAEDFSGQGLGVLGESCVGAVASCDVEHFVGAEGQSAAVVDCGGGDAGEDDFGLLADLEAGDAVVGAGSVVDVDSGVVFEVGGNGESEEAAFALGVDGEFL